MLEELKEQVCEGNLALARAGLVAWTGGNLSARDEAHGVIAGVGADSVEQGEQLGPLRRRRGGRHGGVLAVGRRHCTAHRVLLLPPSS